MVDYTAALEPLLPFSRQSDLRPLGRRVKRSAYARGSPLCEAEAGRPSWILLVFVPFWV